MLWFPERLLWIFGVESERKGRREKAVKEQKGLEKAEWDAGIIRTTRVCLRPHAVHEKLELWEYGKTGGLGGLKNRGAIGWSTGVGITEEN